MAALRGRWSRANPHDRHGELLLQIKENTLQINENQTNQTTNIATLALGLQAVRGQIATLPAGLQAVREHVATLTSGQQASSAHIATPAPDQTDETAPQRPWYQRLNLLLISTRAAVIISAAGAAPWVGG
jgi:hypothetical protein